MTDHTDIIIEPAVLKLVPEALVHKHHILALRVQDGTLHILFPESDDFRINDAPIVEFALTRPVKWVPSERPRIDAQIARYYAASCADPGTIENCDVRFKFTCPQTWESLRDIGVASTRYCDTCSRRVYWARDASEAHALAQQGRCVALAHNDTQTSYLIGEVEEE